VNSISKAVVAAGVGLGATVARKRIVGKRSGSRPEGEDGNRWLAVTVNRSPDQVGGLDDLPGPLTELGDRVEVRIRPASGDKGTELAARLRQPPPAGATGVAARVAGEDPRQRVRQALRDAKAIIETGEVLKADPDPSAHPGPAGKLLQAATRRARGEGRL
jgi:hypothetical protein